MVHISWQISCRLWKAGTVKHPRPRSLDALPDHSIREIIRRWRLVTHPRLETLMHINPDSGVPILTEAGVKEVQEVDK